MRRVAIAISIFSIIEPRALADLRGLPARLDHALWPGQWEPKSVFVGEIIATEPRKLSFQVAHVILGELKTGKTVVVQNGLVWPESYVPYRKGEFCILVLSQPRNSGSADYSVMAVVPGRRRNYKHARDYLEARAFLAEELIGQLRDEKSAQRQRQMLLQLAPILDRSKSENIQNLLFSTDVQVRRATLAALIYATEDKEYIEAAANDIQGYFEKTQGIRSLEVFDDRGLKRQSTPRNLFFETYFFLDPRTFTRGSMWNEAEADKHRRIRDGILDVIDEATRKLLTDESPFHAER